MGNGLAYLHLGGPQVKYSCVWVLGGGRGRHRWSISVSAFVVLLFSPLSQTISLLFFSFIFIITPVSCGGLCSYRFWDIGTAPTLICPSLSRVVWCPLSFFCPSFFTYCDVTHSASCTSRPMVPGNDVNKYYIAWSTIMFMLMIMATACVYSSIGHLFVFFIFCEHNTHTNRWT